MLLGVLKVLAVAAICFGLYELSWRLVWWLEAAVDRHAQSNPLTGIVLPSERVSHVVADSHAFRADQVRHFTLYSLLWLAGFVYVTASDGWVPRFSSVVLGAVVAMCSATVVKGVRYARLRFARARILAKLERERQICDPAGTFPQLVVVHRDRGKAVALFDRLSVEAYSRGMAVQQYGNLNWPSYHLRVTPTTGNVWVLPEQNAAVVRAAWAVVWLDIDEPSQATEDEIAEAHCERKPILRLTTADDGQYRLTADAFDRVVAFDDVAARALDWAVGALSAELQQARPRAKEEVLEGARELVDNRSIADAVSRRIEVLVRYYLHEVPQPPPSGLARLFRDPADGRLWEWYPEDRSYPGQPARLVLIEREAAQAEHGLVPLEVGTTSPTV